MLRRAKWLLLGLVGGLLLFPWAAGLPYRETWVSAYELSGQRCAQLAADLKPTFARARELLAQGLRYFATNYDAAEHSPAEPDASEQATQKVDQPDANPYNPCGSRDGGGECHLSPFSAPH